jgi:hypothetical protein
MFHGLRLVLFGTGLLLIFCQDAQAETWRERQFAGYSAFDSGDLAGAVTHFEAALTLASEEPAAAQDMGAILESLTTAYYAVGRQREAWDTLGRWDRILEKFADEPWTSDQRTFRSLLVEFMTEHPGETSGSDGLHNGNAPRAIPASEPASESSGDYAIHLASLGSDSNVDSSWRKLNAAYPSQLTGRTLIVEPVDLGDQGAFNRILAASFPDLAHAELACRELQAQGQYCAALSLK